MAAFATKEPAYDSFSVSKCDAEGIGQTIVHVRKGNAPGSGIWTVELAARLLTVARNLDGGWKRALEVLCAEAVRQREG